MAAAVTEAVPTPEAGDGAKPSDAEEQQQEGSPEPDAPEGEAQQTQNENAKEGEDEPASKAQELPRPGQTAPHPVPPGTAVEDDNNQHPGNNYPMGGYGAGQQRVGVDSSGQPLPLTINQLAIVASAQNKLPVSKVKNIVMRVGRHTESSAKKSGIWYKNENYVDKNSYSWRNMPLFDDFQRHLWTPEGTVRSSCKK